MKPDPQPSLKQNYDSLFAQLKQSNGDANINCVLQEIGIVESVSQGIASVTGLPGVGFEELVLFPNNIFGIAFNLDENEVGVVLLGDYCQLSVGDQVQRTGRVMDIVVGEHLLGRVINPLGHAVDGKGQLAQTPRLPIERPAPEIMSRLPVTEPLQTGIKVLDALLPVGRGQRELIMGDRQTGKTSIAIDTILNQQDKNVICIYCAIAQKSSSIAKTIATLKQHNALDYTVVMVTEGNDPPGLDYIAPYAATSIGEYFMHAGKDVLIVYDDLTRHARSYRELSLLLRRPPGREAFPGDIFYLHSRLLERSTHLNQENGGGSLTALPIIETEEQNMSAYIPTNLISITDGQIYLSPKLFDLGVLPAVDVGKSVSRVGGKAQRAGFKAVSGTLKLEYAQFEELESFARFGARLDENSLATIEHGKRIRACLKQPESSPLAVSAQIVVLLALTNHFFDTIPLEHIQEAQDAVVKGINTLSQDILNNLELSNDLNKDEQNLIFAMFKEVLEPFHTNTDAAIDQSTVTGEA
ncbi:alternate F1F0 ATPase, F1 subunit alpha [Aliiglaciecola sp. NS0011-25]|uniref:alternate F1F0 ATPase, F1 subunit alpha n=1 Tax=Aliiglaciecola sp. NS0011-25 TaxID=3127654 RepID=UPI00333ED0DC